MMHAVYFAAIVMLCCILSKGEAFGFGLKQQRRAHMVLNAGMVCDSHFKNDVYPATPRSTETKKLKFVGQAASMLGAYGSIMVSKANAAELTEQDFIECLSSMQVCKTILSYIPGFIDAQAYDSGRTNVNYLINFLAIQKQADKLVKSSLDFAEDPDAIDAAQEAAVTLGNKLTELDSTIYTVIFIPGDESGVVAPAAEKYIKMLFGYLKDTNSAFDTLLSVGSETQLANANKITTKRLADLNIKAPFLFTLKNKPPPVKQDP